MDAALARIFSVWLGWFPTFYTTTHVVDFTSWDSNWFQIRQMIMPVAVLTLFNAAALSRFTRASVLDKLNEDYVRNSMIPVVTLIALSIPGIFAGAIITEQIFRINGLGQLLIVAIGQSDVPMVQTLTFMFPFLIVVFNLVAAVTYGSSTRGSDTIEETGIDKTATTQHQQDHQTTVSTPETSEKDRSLGQDVWRQFLRHKGAVVGLVILTIIVLARVLGPFVYPLDPFEINIDSK